MNGMQLAAVLTHVTHVIESEKDLLCALDSHVGDGDHGVSMAIGMRASRQALARLVSPTPSACFQAMSDAFAEEVGASSGVIYESAFGAAAHAIAGRAELDSSADWALILTAIATAIQTTGQAELGDKTMLDAWLPAATALDTASRTQPATEPALALAADAAWNGVQRTAALIPKRGRASLLGERARGYQDAGATSAYLIIKAIRDGVALQAGAAGPRSTGAFVARPDLLRSRLAPWHPSILVWQAYAPLMAAGGTQSAALEEIASMEFFQSIELTHSPEASERTRIRTLVAQHRWTTCVWVSDVQAAEQLNLASLGDATRVHSRKRFQELLYAAAECGATRLAFCSPPDCGARDRAQAIDHLTAELIELSHAAEPLGITILFEGLDHFAHKKGLLGHSDELALLATRVRAAAPGFGLGWDAAHAALNEEDTLVSYHSLAPHALAAHFSDAILERQHPEFGDRHLPIGRGSVLQPARIKLLTQAMRETQRMGSAPLTLAIEEFNTLSQRPSAQSVSRAWSYLEQCLS